MKSDQKNIPKKAVKKFWSKAFTLPEVIVSFSILVLVIVTASNVLTVVIRTNTDNVSSMVAYGLAQEGLEGIRFIRDSNFVLGLDFDGTVQSSSSMVWGEKLFDKISGRPSNFILVNRDNVLKGCSKINLSDCLPLGLKEVGSDVAQLVSDNSTLVYKLVGGGVSGNEFSYIQTDGGLPASGATATQFHRVIHVAPFKTTAASTEFDGIRLSSMVFWNASGNIQKKVVLTSELTDWK